jgi:hypothetical protein
LRIQERVDYEANQLCDPLLGNFGAEIVDTGTQEQSMHACPRHNHDGITRR